MTLNYVLQIQTVLYTGLKLQIYTLTLAIIPRIILYSVTLTGIMRDEFAGKFGSEFVGLRSKLYSCKIHESDNKMEAAGVKRKVA